MYIRGTFWGVQQPLVHLLSSSSALHFFQLFFLVHHPVNRDDQHLIAHAMASYFSVTSQFSEREQLVFCCGTISIPL
jgi:hypothetical protein